MPLRLTACVPMGLTSLLVPPSGIFSKSAESPDLASGIEGLPCRLLHFAAFVVRQAPWIGTDLVGVARLIAIRRVGRDRKSYRCCHVNPDMSSSGVDGPA